MSIKKRLNSLTWKTSLLTALLLSAACILTYLFIYWSLPPVCTTKQNDKIVRNSKILVDKLKRSTLQTCGPMVDQFMEENQSTVSLEDGRNNPVNLPTTYTVPDSRFSYGIGGFTNLNLLFLQPSSKATSIYLSSSLMYNLKFADSGEKYTLSVTCPMEKVNPVGNVLEPILPVLALAILIMSLAGSVFYSLYVAKPIIKISGISKKISELNFKEHCRENRKDEIGILAHSLNAMSNQLSAAMADLQKTNALLKSDMERERELERQRLAFFSAVSHELKTPITIIKGQIEGMINHVGVYKDRDKYLLRALQTADKMDSMVRELLVVSHMESSDFALHREDINFSYLLLENIHEYEEIPEESARQFFLYIEPDIMVNADRALLQKAVANLISNATKYSPQGEIIEIAAHRRNGGLYCSIENGGVHIPDEALPRLFDAFYRTEQSRGRKTGGSGMGLYLVKIILERHGADFGIENTEKGVRFWFALPA